MSQVLHLDFETRSAIDLKAVGLHNYARHPSTDVWCMGYAFDEAEVQMMLFAGQPIERCAGGANGFTALYDHVASGGIVVAHNAAFEFEIWNEVLAKRYGWPPLKIEQMRCTMAMAYAMALPGSLEGAAAAVGIKHQKDMAGHRLMLQMCRPRTTNEDGSCIWWDDPDKVAKLAEYCKQDVRVEQELYARLMPLSPQEQAMWVLDHAINSRGITVDREAVEAAMAVVKYEQERLARRIQEVTKGFVSLPSEHARLTRWINDNGVDTSGVAKADVVDLLSKDTLPPHVREALLIRREYAKSSTAKLKAMLEAASPTDNRLRGMFAYHGAGTGRWAGRKVQLQNLPRPMWEDPEKAEACIGAMVEHDTEQAADMLDILYGSPLDVVASCLRGMLVAAPGKDLLAADFANIEGRALAWLAGEAWKIQAFIDYDTILGRDQKGDPIRKGPDIYKLAYSKSFGVPIESVGKPERQVGKVQELALGYGGGVGAFQSMARVYGVKVGNEQADVIKNLWRQAHPRIVDYWYALERAATEAVQNPGAMCAAGPEGRKVKFRVAGSFLWCMLPSSRVLCYPYPKLKMKMTPWGEEREQIHYMVKNSVTDKWEETHTYGGKLSENVTQAVARDVLADAMKRIEASGVVEWRDVYDAGGEFAYREGLDSDGVVIVLHVHDEVVAEIPSWYGSGALRIFESMMATVPAWASGLPIAVEGWRGRRYRK